MQVLIYSVEFKEKDKASLQALFDALDENGVNTYIYSPYLAKIKDKIDINCTYAGFDDYRSFRVHKIDAVMVLGGDGTMLSAATLVRDSAVPLFGINLGRMGFLANVEKEMIGDSVKMLATGRYVMEERTSLYLESQPQIFGETPFALNDCTLLKRDTSSMITVHTFVNGDHLNSYWADGLIIATPTGSTGYSLSCGGPIIFPDSKNFVLTPVAPHNLNVRPIVISDDSVITFEVEGRAEHFICTLDSRIEIITAQHQIAVRKNDFTIKLIRPEEQTFLDTLRKKLMWGNDIRN